MTITRTAENTYTVETTRVMSDGRFMADYNMALDGDILRSREERGVIRVGGLMNVSLGPKSLPLVQALGVGESVTLTR